VYEYTELYVKRISTEVIAKHEMTESPHVTTLENQNSLIAVLVCVASIIASWPNDTATVY